MKRLVTQYSLLCSRIHEIKAYVEKTLMKNDALVRLEQSVAEVDKTYIDYLKSLRSSAIPYNAIIISLYGCFENYIDGLLAEFGMIMFQECESLEKLPHRISSKLREKVGEFLGSPRRFKRMDIEEEPLLQEYVRFLKADFSGDLKIKLVKMHGGNLWATEVFSLLRDFGIENANALILASNTFSTNIQTLLGIDQKEYDSKKKRVSQDNIDESELYAPLSRLVEQRNSVAHSWKDDNRITAYDLKNKIIPFIDLLAKVILELCLIEIMKKRSLDGEETSGAKPIRTYRNHILCMNSENNSIHKGDFILYKSGDLYKCSQIINIQVNGVDVDRIDERENVAAGVLLEDTVKDTDEVLAIVAHK